jgi:hypothetical protein
LVNPNDAKFKSILYVFLSSIQWWSPFFIWVLILVRTGWFVSRGHLCCFEYFACTSSTCSAWLCWVLVQYYTRRYQGVLHAQI